MWRDPSNNYRKTIRIVVERVSRRETFIFAGIVFKKKTKKNTTDAEAEAWMKNFQKKKNKHSFLIKRGAFRSRRADSPSSAVIRVTTPRKPSPFAICLCCLFFYETVSDSTLLFEEGSQKKKKNWPPLPPVVRHAKLLFFTSIYSPKEEQEQKLPQRIGPDETMKKNQKEKKCRMKKMKDNAPMFEWLHRLSARWRPSAGVALKPKPKKKTQKKQHN